MGDQSLAFKLPEGPCGIEQSSMGPPDSSSKTEFSPPRMAVRSPEFPQEDLLSGTHSIVKHESARRCGSSHSVHPPTSKESREELLPAY